MIKIKIPILLVFLCCLFSSIPLKTHAQNASNLPVTIKGRVIDVKKEPLIGVGVTVKGTTNAVITDMDGNYSITCNNNDELVFSYIGFVSKELKVAGQKELNVVLEEDNKVLDEVIVIGYGTTTRKHIIGAADQITSRSIENRPVANITQALQGTSPGLAIQQRSMDPNDNTMNINIRGINTTTNNDPLVVIDGLITNLGNMNKLNPADIASISVLKDAGSAAIYGSRSAGGVIIITTKQGEKNTKPKIRFNSMVGVQTPKILYTPLDGWQNATMINTALTNGGKSPAFTPSEIEDLYNKGNADWMVDYIFKNALHQSYNVSVSGGSENTTYMVSGGYLDQESNFIGPDYGISRYNLRSNITTEYNRFKLNVILGYTRENAKGDEGGGFKISGANSTPRYYYNAVKTPDGRYVEQSVGGNAAALFEQGGYNKHNNDFVNVGISLDYKILDDLKIRGVFGYDLTSNSRFIRRTQYDLYAYGSGADSTPTKTERSTNDAENYSFKGTFINTQLMLDYNKTLGNHRLSAMAGISQEVLNEKSSDAKTIRTDAELGIPIDEGDAQTNYSGSRTQINSTKERKTKTSA
ncbi:SusC/RagA family TonB-linked outer membrane protein [Dysgonomonas sp. 511]|uniref:SusC/RagA family TonB-linked outer membrane protein n=1 Tax=Dysgonomonas sp. 511 TaxID=2302930 RepID=UPI0013D65E62|nr:SusC/RagA family TonB-linked outer membrane protein [Dysgonomonas sp. 511]NDV77529.1 SusC/RagA family TonB-linked outer membrane protein [Dysgonomonas sp. 511]